MAWSGDLAFCGVPACRAGLPGVLAFQASLRRARRHRSSRSRYGRSTGQKTRSRSRSRRSTIKKTNSRSRSRMSKSRSRRARRHRRSRRHKG